MSRWTRAAAMGAGGAAIAAYVYLALATHAARTQPDAAWGSSLLGAQPDVLYEAAGRRLTEALAALQDGSRPGPVRLADYRTRLAQAERLLEQSLAAQPAQPRALIRLATVRWELSTQDAAARQAEAQVLLDAAARMAPGAASVQFDLGRLLLSMGRDVEGLARLHTAVELRPDVVERAVAALHEAGQPLPAIVAGLPDPARTLEALAPAYREEERPAEFVEAAEPLLASARAGLWSAYGSACLDSDQAARLLDTMARVSPRDPHVAAERALQISRAHAAQRAYPEALAAARSARELRPDDPWLAEHEGYIALAGGDAGAAIAAYGDALRLLAQRGGSAAVRARVYASIGVAEERRQNLERAYDAYRRALALDPRQPHAARRMAEMHGALYPEAP